MFLDQGRLGGGLDFNFLCLYQLTHTKWRERGRDYFLRDPVMKYTTWGIRSQVMSHKKTRISITQWLLLHVTWPLSLLYQLESQYASAHIFLAGVVTDPSPLRDEYLISMLRKIGVWWHRHGCAALVLLWVTWILENVSICEENPVGWI